MINKRLLWVVGCLVLLPLASLPAQKYNIYHTELENGLDVIVVENPSVPLTTVEIDVRNGAYTEPPEFDGLSHLYEHMFFKANEAIPDQETFLERTRELGMVWNGTTSEERVNYYFTLSKDSLQQGMEFMKAAIRTPLFLEEELVRERPVVTGEYDRNEANPYFHLFRAVDQKVWHKYYSRKNVMGEREVILTTTPEKMRAIQQRYYIPNNSSLLVAGDVNHEEIFKMAETYFGDWQRGENPFEKFLLPQHPPIPKTETVVVEKPVNAVTIMIRLHGPSVSKDKKSTFAADVFSFVLSQNNSKFQKNLVDSGLFSNVNLTYYTLDYTGPITIFAQTTAEKFAGAQKALHAEIEKFSDPGYFSDEQMEYAKTRLEIGEMYGQERPSTFIHTLGFWWSVAGGLDYYLNYVDNLKKVNRRDIDNYIKTYIQNQPYIKGILVSPQDREKLAVPLEGKEESL
jgi:zinc protease